MTVKIWERWNPNRDGCPSCGACMKQIKNWPGLPYEDWACPQCAYETRWNKNLPEGFDSDE